MYYILYTRTGLGSGGEMVLHNGVKITLLVLVGLSRLLWKMCSTLKFFDNVIVKVVLCHSLWHLLRENQSMYVILMNMFWNKSFNANGKISKSHCVTYLTARVKKEEERVFFLLFRFSSFYVAILAVRGNNRIQCQHLWILLDPWKVDWTAS